MNSCLEWAAAQEGQALTLHFLLHVWQTFIILSGCSAKTHNQGENTSCQFRHVSKTTSMHHLV